MFCFAHAYAYEAENSFLEINFFFEQDDQKTFFFLNPTFCFYKNQSWDTVRDVLHLM